MFINEYKDYPVVEWATYLEVSTSGYYTWLKRIPEQKIKKEAFDSLVREIFKSGCGTYGSERICGTIRKKGYKPVIKRSGAV